MACCCAVLLDTVSIQQYVFGSNRLQDNLGVQRWSKGFMQNRSKNA